MKTNLILFSAVLACSTLSFAAVSGTSRPQRGTGNQPAKDSSEAVYDQAINPDQNTRMKKSTRQGRASRWDYHSDSKSRAIDTDTDSSGHKTDQAPSIQE